MYKKLKLFICLPSYNEAKNIKNITRKIDKALRKLVKEYECIIINADNKSSDGTNDIFNATKTRCKKVSILDENKGKGINIINFMKYFKENNGDYAILIDTDLKSLKKKWIYNMLKELRKNIDFVFPLYKRKIYEGNTTNHFVVPALYALTGKKIRQPIGGDYAFNSKYVDLFLQQEISDEIKSYGVDIFMVSLVFKYNLNYSQVKLGKKVHSLSYNKMEKIFVDVAESFRVSFKEFKNVEKEKEDKLIYNSISNNRWNKYKNKVIEKNKYRYDELKIDISQYERIKELWIKAIVIYLLEMNEFDNKEIISMENLFMCYVLAYWKKFEKSNIKECENYIWDLAQEVSKRRNEKNEISYK